MDLKNLEYSRIASSSMFRESAEVIFLLDNGSCVPKDFVDHISEHLEEKISELEPGERKTLKQICGDDFWLQLSRWCKIIAGKYVADLVARKHLPLSFAGTNHSNSKLYERM